MSDDSISRAEDKENLLYISKKLNVHGFGLAEDQYLTSVLSEESLTCEEFAGSDADLATKLSKDIGPTTFQDPKLTAKLRPFQHMITSISCDSSGRWVVTGDSDPDGVIIFWDTIELKPVLTLFNLYPESGVLAVEISHCAKYVITIGREGPDYKIDFWLWTLGEDKPNETAKVDAATSGLPVKICFNAETEEHIMVVFQKEVYLFIWNEEKKKLIGPFTPQLTHRNKIGILTSGTYINRSHACYASSSRGCILIFRHSLHSKSYEEGELRNDKVFINAVKVTQSSIGVITTTDGILVVGDSKGHMYFFDYRVRILYWLKHFPLFSSITSISFNLTPKEYKYVDGDRIIVKCKSINDDYIFDCDFKDITEEIKKICSVEVPFDASLKNNPFLMRDFFITTADCNIYAIDFLGNSCTPLFYIADANISAIEIHDEKPYILMGYENGRITITDYEKNEKISKYYLPKTHDDHDTIVGCEKPDSISCIRYSPESLHLICGRENGEIWVLEPLTLDPKIDTPFKHTKNKVVNIAFSSNALQFAYYDNNKTVILFVKDTERLYWTYQGKVRSHYGPITDIKFSPDVLKSTLSSIGEDRYLIQYNNLNCEKEPFGILRRERIYQFSYPTSFVHYSKLIYHKETNYFLIADSDGKLKLVHESTKIARATVLGPAYGCFRNSPIRKMKVLRSEIEFRYMVFLCNKHIGLHILPPDGNPYKYNGYLAHPKQVVDFVVSHDGKYMFTFGVDDRCVLMWEIMPRSVEIMHIMGGKELEPFYCLLEGGKNGWLFQEIQDLFFYMQILKQENIDLPRRVSDDIPLSEIPDLVRACGFYPSDFVLETMLIDIKYRDYDENSSIREEISFIEFVKLFINHRPTYGYSLNELRNKFDIITRMAGNPKINSIHSEDFINILENSGETLPSLQKHLATLMRTKATETKIVDYLPRDISNEFFFGELLGIDLERNAPQPAQKEVLEDQENMTD